MFSFSVMYTDNRKDLVPILFPRLWLLVLFSMCNTRECDQKFKKRSGEGCGKRLNCNGSSARDRNLVVLLGKRNVWLNIKTLSR